MNLAQYLLRASGITYNNNNWNYFEQKPKQIHSNVEFVKINGTLYIVNYSDSIELWRGRKKSNSFEFSVMLNDHWDWGYSTRRANTINYRPKSIISFVFGRTEIFLCSDTSLHRFCKAMVIANKIINKKIKRKRRRQRRATIRCGVVCRLPTYNRNLENLYIKFACTA